MNSTLPEALHPIFEAYLDFQAARGCAPSTAAGSRRALERFEEWIRSTGADPSTIGPVEANRYVNVVLRAEPTQRPGAYGRNRRTPLSGSTRQRELVIVRAAYALAIDLDLIRGPNPCRRVRVDTVPHRPRQFFSPEDLRAILWACDRAPEAATVLLLMLTGLRLGELTSLCWTPVQIRTRRGDLTDSSWVDIEGERLHILGKGERYRVVPTHPLLLPLLIAMRSRAGGNAVINRPDGRGYNPRRMLDFVTAPLRRAGVKEPYAAAHTFRRTFNDTLLVNGRGFDVERRALLGHAPGSNVNERHYTRVTYERLAGLVARAYADCPELLAELPLYVANSTG